MSPNIDRKFTSTGPRALKVIPPLVIKRIVRQGATSQTVISLKGEAKGTDRLYVSDNEGKTWLALPSNVTRASTIPSIYYDPDGPTDAVELMSAVDPRVIYAYVGGFQNFIRLSRDGGKKWEEFLPKIHTPATVTGLAVISTGMKAAPRLYAMVWTTNGSGIFRSDDYGHTFKPFANNLQLVVECRADDSLLYGLSGDVLVKTANGGQDWAVVESAKFLYQPLYRTKENHLTTVKQRINDPQGPTASVIEQIESDPLDPTIVYLRTGRGLFRSTDQANSWRLLPLATDVLYGIVDVVVDPVRRAHLYAVVGNSSLRSSSDWGCSWVEVPLPGRPD